jgi:hypothetical protein
MYGFLGNSKNIIDLLLLIIPFLFVLFLILKFVLPKRPALGIGLAGGVGLLGYFLVKRRLRHAFDVEKKIAEHNRSMAEFKERQKTRYDAVTANNQIIKSLEEQRKRLMKDEHRYENEIKLIDAEVEERRALNENLLQSSSTVLEEIRERSGGRRDLLRRTGILPDAIGIAEPVPEPVSAGEVSDSDLEVDGYRLLEV